MHKLAGHADTAPVRSLANLAGWPTRAGSARAAAMDGRMDGRTRTRRTRGGGWRHEAPQGPQGAPSSGVLAQSPAPLRTCAAARRRAPLPAAAGRSAPSAQCTQLSQPWRRRVSLSPTPGAAEPPWHPPLSLTPPRQAPSAARVPRAASLQPPRKHRRITKLPVHHGAAPPPPHTTRRARAAARLTTGKVILHGTDAVGVLQLHHAGVAVARHQHRGAGFIERQAAGADALPGPWQAVYQPLCAMENAHDGARRGVAARRQVQVVEAARGVRKDGDASRRHGQLRRLGRPHVFAAAPAHVADAFATIGVATGST